MNNKGINAPLNRTRLIRTLYVAVISKLFLMASAELKPWELDEKALLKAYGSDLKGLTTEQVEERKKKYGPNGMDTQATLFSLSRLVVCSFFHPFFLTMLIFILNSSTRGGRLVFKILQRHLSAHRKIHSCVDYRAIRRHAREDSPCCRRHFICACPVLSLLHLTPLPPACVLFSSSISHLSALCKLHT